MKIAVYTAITDERDVLKKEQCTEGADFLFFTDMALEDTDPWTVRLLPSGRSPRRMAKHPKICAHRYVGAYEYSIWMDGACTLRQSASVIIETYLQDADVALFRNPERDCVYDEATFCSRLALDDAAVLAAQTKRYADARIPAHAGLFEAGVIVRRHSPAVRRWEEAWWAETVRGSIRDQVSLPVSLRTAGIEPTILPGTVRQNPGLFSYTEHPTPWGKRKQR